MPPPVPPEIEATMNTRGDSEPNGTPVRSDEAATASALLIRSAPDSHWFAVPIFLLSSLLGLWLIYGIFRSGSV